MKAESTKMTQRRKRFWKTVKRAAGGSLTAVLLAAFAAISAGNSNTDVQTQTFVSEAENVQEQETGVMERMAQSGQDKTEAAEGTAENGSQAEAEFQAGFEPRDAESQAGSEPQDVESQTEPESGTEEKFVVAIDPGHQGSWVDMSELEPSAPGSSEMKAKATTGTQGRFTGTPEYELNLEISLLLRDELESRGYDVVLTREDNDTAISNAERATMAYEEGGDIYVRIHANGSDDSGVNGALAMVPSPQNPYVGNLAEDSYLLADGILNAYCEKAGFASLGIQYYDNMTGINWSRLPVMILEMGFMTNESDDLRMADEAVQKRMAEGIADGIDAYFLQKRSQEEAEEETAAG